MVRLLACFQLTDVIYALSVCRKVRLETGFLSSKRCCLVKAKKPGFCSQETFRILLKGEC